MGKVWVRLVRGAGLTVAGTFLAIACGGSDEGSTKKGPGPDAGAGDTSQPGFNFGDSGSGCKPKTCSDLGIECGPAGDGCGGVIANCGDCAAGLRCGGPGAPSKCVSAQVDG